MNDGNEIPVIGFGTFQIQADGTTYNAVKDAMAAGYRPIDPAAAYRNEQEGGQAIKASCHTPDTNLVTTKAGLHSYNI
ncbi:aldo/keto reductase [Limosilactobacillus reuteri]|uniref:aldo/keto reductase n=1 Tax=Limosilactobacillus reuteri TaxID=1598 RepID=UPI0015C667A6